MRRLIRTAALSAILLVPLVISAPGDWGAFTSAQPAPSYIYQGTVRAAPAATRRVVGAVFIRTTRRDIPTPVISSSVPALALTARTVPW